MGRSAVPIDFTLTPEQLRLRGDARAFARDVLSKVESATRDLPTPLARFAATRPFYEQTVGAGFLRRLIPAPLGGQGTGIVDMAGLAEEGPTRHVHNSPTLLAPLPRPLPPPAAGRPGPASAAPAPAEGVRTQARLVGDRWVISGAKKWVSSGTGWDGKGADLLTVVCRTDPDAPPESGISVIAVSGPAEGIVLDRAIDSVGHRAHLQPQFRLNDVHTPADHLIGPRGGGKALAEACFTGTAPIVGVFAVGLMRAAFDCALNFTKTEKRGGVAPIISHQAVGYALADAKMAIEAVRSLSLRAAHAFDKQVPGALELALHAKAFGSETAVRVISDLMRVVGIDSYDRTLPLGGLLTDALVLPLFDGGNMGGRRRQLHELMQMPDYDPLAASGD